MRSKAKRILCVLLCLMLVFSLGKMDASAATKKYVKSMTVSKSKVTVKAGKKAAVTVSVKVSGKAKAGIKVKNLSKSVIGVKAGKTNKKGKTTITITGKKAGKGKFVISTVAKKKNKKVIQKTIKVNVSDKTPNKTPTPQTPDKTPDKTPTPQTPDKTPTPQVPDKTPTPQVPDKDPTPTPPAQPVSNEVKWTTSFETFTGYYSRKNETTGETENIPKELTRKYVSFNPWPTTNEQVEYVVKNCDDPYVVAALYIVALDNFEYKGLGNYTPEVYKMLDTLMNGAGTVTGSSYQLSNIAKQQICGFGNKQVVSANGTVINASTFASRAYLKGATPYNNYTPEGGMTDKTKWKIVMDEYVYCGDLANGYITVCPQRYGEEQESAGGKQTVIEHWQGIRIGMRWNKTAKVWLPTDDVSLNNPPTGALVPFAVDKQVLFSSNYMAPQDDQGW